MTHNIHIIATGGTIDSKFHAPKEGSLVKNETGIPAFLSDIIQPHFTFSTTQLCMLDSGDITDTIREQIVDIIHTCEEQYILITHGTNTMTETLSYITNKLESTTKTIILTGAMIPLDGFCSTDSGFNLGYAIAKLEELPAGVYIAMNGKIFENGKVEKNFGIARFEDK